MSVEVAPGAKVLDVVPITFEDCDPGHGTQLKVTRRVRQ